MEQITAARTALKSWETIVGTAELAPLPTVTNPLWKVEAGGRAYVLKKLPEYPPGAGPVDEFRVQNYLQGAGIPVAAPIVTDEASIYTLVGETRYALLPLLPNDPGNHELGPNASAVSYAIGGAIGRLDAALAACPWPVRSFVDDPARQLVEEWLPGLPDDTRTLVEPMKEQLYAATVDLSTQRTHGDCNAGNVLVHRGEVSGFIDLDHLPTGARPYDLANYLMSRLQRHLEIDDPAERDRAAAAWVSVLGPYVAGFHEAYALSQRERAAVVPLILLRQTGNASWWLHGWTPQPEKYERSVRTIGWIVEHYEELEAAAATGC